MCCKNINVHYLLSERKKQDNKCGFPQKIPAKIAQKSHFLHLDNKIYIVFTKLMKNTE